MNYNSHSQIVLASIFQTLEHFSTAQKRKQSKASSQIVESLTYYKVAKTLETNKDTSTGEKESQSVDVIYDGLGFETSQREKSEVFHLLWKIKL